MKFIIYLITIPPKAKSKVKFNTQKSFVAYRIRRYKRKKNKKTTPASLKYITSNFVNLIPFIYLNQLNVFFF